MMKNEGDKKRKAGKEKRENNWGNQENGFIVSGVKSKNVADRYKCLLSDDSRFSVSDK